jgi:hypothetical protein
LERVFAGARSRCARGKCRSEGASGDVRFFSSLTGRYDGPAPEVSSGDEGGGRGTSSTLERSTFEERLIGSVFDPPSMCDDTTG